MLVVGYVVPGSETVKNGQKFLSQSRSAIGGICIETNPHEKKPDSLTICSPFAPPPPPRPQQRPQETSVVLRI